jgi:hypothetical protein
MAQYAVKDSDGAVINIIEYDGESEFNPGEGCSLEALTDEHSPQFGEQKEPATVKQALENDTIIFTKGQLLLWLLQNKKKTEKDVVEILSGIKDDTERETALIKWNYPDQPFRRSSQVLQYLTEPFGLNIDDLAVEARNL